MDRKTYIFGIAHNENEKKERKKALKKSGSWKKRSKSHSVIQNITVNIQDSVVQGDVITSAPSEEE